MIDKYLKVFYYNVLSAITSIINNISGKLSLIKRINRIIEC